MIGESAMTIQLTLLYVDKTGIFHGLDYNKHGTYRIIEVFTNGTVRVPKIQVNEQINIIWLSPHFRQTS